MKKILRIFLNNGFERDQEHETYSAFTCSGEDAQIFLNNHSALDVNINVDEAEMMALPYSILWSNAPGLRNFSACQENWAMLYTE